MPSLHQSCIVAPSSPPHLSLPHITVMPSHYLHFFTVTMTIVLAVTRASGIIDRRQQQGPVFVIEPKTKVEFMNRVGGRLDCSAHGSPSVKVTWLIADSLEPVKSIPGLLSVAGNGSLVLQPFTSQAYRQDVHATNYVCQASNVQGTIRSVPVTVRAVMEQVYQGQVYDEYVIRGNTAVFKCQLPSFVRDDVIVTNWIVNGQIILPEDRKYATFPSGKLHVLAVENNDDLNKFRCETRHRLNGAVHLSSEAGHLHVTDSRSSIQPQKGHHEQVIYTLQGSDVGLPCAAQSHPPPQYSWLKIDSDRSKLDLAGNDRYEFRGGSLMLGDVVEVDSAVYMCYINNSLGHLALKTKLVVTAPLRVYIDKEQMTVDVGRNASLICHISGYPVSSVKWMHNGKEVEDKRYTTSWQESGRRHVLYISSMSRHGAGMYQCFVSNHVHTVQATAQILLGDVKPELLEVFSSVTSQPGPSVTLKCVTGGSPAPSISWYLYDVELPKSKVTTYTNQHGDVVSTLRLTSVTAQRDGGTYSCVASNSRGTASHSATLHVFGVPGIRSMSNITMASGQDFKVVCNTYGYPIAQVSWFKDGAVLSNSENRKVLTNGTVIIRQADKGRDSGQYSCVARNRHGQTSTGMRHVIILDKPVLSDIKFPDGVVEGWRVTVLCTILKGEPPVTTSWTKDAMPIASNDVDVIVTHTSSYSILDIEKVGRRHAGSYSCHASNKVGDTTKDAKLIVQGPPQWDVKPQDVSALEGSTVRLECQGKGDPMPVAKWSMEERQHAYGTVGKAVPRIEATNTSDGTLILRSVSKSQQGLYTCVLSNGIGSDLQTQIRLTVGVSPKIAVSKSVVEAAIGSKAVLWCNVSGDSRMVVNWRRDEGGTLTPIASPPTQHTRDRYEISKEDRINKVLVRLTIKQTVLEDSGTFFCLAKNSFGNSNSSVRLVIQERPGKVEQISMLNAKNYSVQIVWQRPNYDGHSNISKYIVFYKPTSGRYSLQKVEFIVPKYKQENYELKIEGFVPTKQYKAWLVAENKVGQSDESQSIIFRFADNGTLIVSKSTNAWATSSPSIPNLLLLLVLPSVAIIVFLIIVIIVVYVCLRHRRAQRQRQRAPPLSAQHPDNVEKKLSDEDPYKNIGLLAELRDKQSEMRYGKIQSDGTYRSSRSARYHVLSAPPGVAPPLPADNSGGRLQREYDKRWSAIYSPYAPGASHSEIYYSEVSPYATSHVRAASQSDDKDRSTGNVVDMKTYALPGYVGETGVTAL